MATKKESSTRLWIARIAAAVTFVQSLFPMYIITVHYSRGYTESIGEPSSAWMFLGGCIAQMIVIVSGYMLAETKRPSGTIPESVDPNPHYDNARREI